MCIEQEIIEEKINEITAIPEVIKIFSCFYPDIFIQNIKIM